MDKLMTLESISLYCGIMRQIIYSNLLALRVAFVAKLCKQNTSWAKLFYFYQNSEVNNVQ